MENDFLNAEQIKSRQKFAIKIIFAIILISIISPFIVFYITKLQQSVFSQYIIKKEKFFIQVFEQEKPYKDFVRLIVFLDNPKIKTKNSLHINPLTDKGICSLPRALFIDGKDITRYFAKKYFDKNIKVFIVKNKEVFPIRFIDNFYFKDIKKNNLLQSELWNKFIAKKLSQKL